MHVYVHNIILLSFTSNLIPRISFTDIKQCKQPKKFEKHEEAKLPYHLHMDKQIVYFSFSLSFASILPIPLRRPVLLAAIRPTFLPAGFIRPTVEGIPMC